MHKALVIKVAIILGLTLGLMVPLGMVSQLIDERAARQEAVVSEIAASSAGAQRLIGPILVLPYQEEFTQEYWEKETIDGELKRVRRIRQVKVDGRALIMPSSAQMQFDGRTSVKRRGLFKALVYELEGGIQGRFVIPAQPALERQQENSHIQWGQPYLSLGLSDTRGLARTPQLQWDGTPIDFAQGTLLDPTLPQGMHVPLPSLIQVGQGRAPFGDGSFVDGADADEAEQAPREIPFSITLAFRGTESVSFVPLADSTRIELASTWPHPSFQGRFLPNADGQTIDADGFSALWEVSALATAAPANLCADVAAGRDCLGGCADWLGVRFIEPVNIYSMSNRAAKYGILFIGLTFAAVLLLELLRSLKVHPAQYLLVGLALALFFLLLLSLSEHIAFGLAYGLATLGCVSLLGYYLIAVLGSVKRGAGFALLLAVLFAALYGLLMSEDAALLMGSLLLFGLLALTMVLTRRLDWYALEKSVA
ncbi:MULTISPECIES: cell envelope integrity protein CreD [Thiorhodovibrio]|uniref:cell envelope integrity protein CreD n=1 Tax=Thiorhodovibrio TaxID=61593 RepID=UPI001911A85E|nr:MULTISPECIES: cell envelope integrity protein CreD [Thiorhodovibrio]MBK5971189.1 cell envelope integrity protein CreD [Thiorhodovibrio winogradskyi]WPL12311.1 Inner membrane protein CreD [Thiorhodovibrio litoralis]